MQIIRQLWNDSKTQRLSVIVEKGELIGTIDDFDKFADFCRKFNAKHSASNLKLYVTQIRNLLFIENSNDVAKIEELLNNLDYNE
jgi:hypothetical protein